MLNHGRYMKLIQKFAVSVADRLVPTICPGKALSQIEGLAIIEHALRWVLFSRVVNAVSGISSCKRLEEL